MYVRLETLGDLPGVKVIHSVSLIKITNMCGVNPSIQAMSGLQTLNPQPLSSLV